MMKPHEKPVIVFLPKEVATAFKTQCAQEERTMKSVLERSIRDFLAESAAPQQGRPRHQSQQPEA